MNKFLVVGIGNYEPKYEFTRHNVGFRVLDNFVSEHNLSWKFNKSLNCYLAEYHKLILVKPKSYVNICGPYIKKALNYYKIPLENLIVLHDDIDLPFGKIQKKFNIGSAGHNGIRDLFHNLGTKEFFRIRIGVGRPIDLNVPIDKYVLQKFTQDELEFVNKVKLLDILDL
jgi:PTH1 family peptidyl-tRNA hydrolase